MASLGVNRSSSALLALLVSVSLCSEGACSTFYRDDGRRHLRSRAQANASEHCSLVTGGDCFIFGCDDTRGGATKVECVEGYCLCKIGYCNLNGACVKAVEKDTTDSLFTPVHQAIRWSDHPEECIYTFDGYARLYPCGASPQQFVMPIGITGQLQIKDTDTCLGTLNNTNVVGTYVGVLPCDKADPRQEWDMPNGGNGLIRWSSHPDKCLTVEGGSVVPGVPLVISACSSSDLKEQFGTSFNPPPSHLDCTSAAGCSMFKKLRVRAYCGAKSDEPWCRRLKQCPPGGCRNGDCVEGACTCRLGFTGPTCEIAASGPVPISSAEGTATEDDVAVFSGPAPAPAPALGSAIA